MSRQKWTLIVAAWVLSLVAVAAAAQSRGISPLPQPLTVTGADIAFRVDGMQGDTPVGKLLIRFEGRWVEPRTAPGVSALQAE